MPHTSRRIKTQCASCSLKELCLPVGLQSVDFEKLDGVIKQSRRLRKGDYLYHSGENFQSIYAVRTGFFKTLVSLSDNHAYTNNAVALEDSEVCELPFNRLDELAQFIPSLNLHFFRLMSREIIRDRNVMMILGNMNAEERLSAFLINLSQRLAARGFAANDFVLRMSREEIGSYLGLKLETVSRTLSRLHHDGIVSVEHKHIRILQPQALRQMRSQSLSKACSES